MNDSLMAFSHSLAEVVERASRAIVTVHGRPRIASSGIHWAAGIVVTADHTLRREEEIQVTLPGGETVPAELAGRDAGTDLAVLRMATLVTPDAAIREGSPFRAGELVLAVGRSQTAGVNAAMGILSTSGGPWRTWRGGHIEQLLKLDLALYPGSSGGAVVDAAGRIAGLATSGLSRVSPIAVPVETIRRVVRDILDKGRVARGYLGVGLQPIALPDHLKTALRRETRSALIVLSVEPDAPAARAGVGIGDILLALDGKPVADTDDVQAVLGPDCIGKKVAVEILRGGERKEAVITIAEKPGRNA
ncbi:MAG: S1C family serine protease [Bryobacteraceae bacterium]|nr:S1C family serine protease [Bryobacteraceae bacterium]